MQAQVCLSNRGISQMRSEETMPAKMPREFTLDDLLNDPIVRLVMKADGVSEADLRIVLEKVRGYLTSPGERLAA